MFDGIGWEARHSDDTGIHISAWWVKLVVETGSISRHCALSCAHHNSFVQSYVRRREALEIQQRENRRVLLMVWRVDSVI